MQLHTTNRKKSFAILHS